MSQNTFRHLLSAALAALLLATASCGDNPSDAAAPATEGGYPLDGVCVYDEADNELCGQKGADWCKAHIAQRDKVRANDDDVDVQEIACEGYEG